MIETIKTTCISNARHFSHYFVQNGNKISVFYSLGWELYPSKVRQTKKKASTCNIRPSNPHHMQIWRFWKKVQKNLEIGTSNLEISKICVKFKKKKNGLLVWVFFTFVVPPVVFFCCFAVDGWGSKDVSESFCDSVSFFPRDLSTPMFHWNWHCTRVFSQTSLINSVGWLLWTDYSIFLHTLRIFLAISRFSGSPWDLVAKPWDREMASQTVSLTVKPWELEGLLVRLSELVYYGIRHYKPFEPNF